jgi:hypothetical protein
VAETAAPVGAPGARWSFAAVPPAAPPRPETLPDGTRHELERRFGSPLEGVRVHADEEGRREAARHSAIAVARGSELFFADGAYAPGTDRGDRILRHEVAHLLQSRAAGPAWPEAMLEAEADVAASAPGPVAIRGRARAGAPLPMKTFISTVAGSGYLEAAVKFFKLWENETAIRIASHEDVVTSLAKDTGALSEFRIVAHGNPYNLFLPLLAQGKGYASKDDLGLQTQAQLAGELGRKAHVTTDMTAQVYRWLAADKAASALLGRLKLTAAPTGMLQEFLWWVVDEHWADHATESAASGTGTPSAPGDKTALAAEVKPVEAAVESLAVAALPATASKADLDELRTRTLAAFAAQSWSWTVGQGEIKEKLDRFRDPDNVALAREVKAGTFEDSLKKVKARVSDKTYIEIRGCNVGRNDDYLNAVRAYFGTKPDKLPSISAPTLYQFFGRPGVAVVPEGRGAPPLADSLKFIFEETFDDQSTAAEVAKAIRAARLTSVAGLADVLRYADVKAQFDAWFQMKKKQTAGATASPPAATTPATLKDFQDFLTAAPRTVPINTPGAGASSLFVLLLIPSKAVPALVGWVKDQGYALPGGEDLKKKYFGGSDAWDPAKLTKALDELYVDWLGDDYPIPQNIFFPESPDYKSHFRRLP